MSALIVGVFVGGEARRMGGIAKGLLHAPQETRSIVERLVSLAREVGAAPCLVGRDSRVAATLPDVPMLDDEPPGIGPLGGLSSVLAHAGSARVIAVGCDMPFLTRGLLERLIACPSTSPIVAPRASDDRGFETMFARYDSQRVWTAVRSAIERGERSLQHLFATLGADALELAPAEREQLRDWDSPSDVA